MWKIKNTQAQRHLHILTQFFIENRVLSVETLSSELGCDTKTIYYTLEQINMIYDVPELYVDSNTHILKTTGNKESFYILDIYQYFYENTLEFNILEMIFLFGPISSEELASKLYISDSTVKRNISHLKSNLKQYGISISGRKHEILGNEFKVRSFFIQFYREKNSCQLYDNFDIIQQTAFSVFTNICSIPKYSVVSPLFGYFRWIFFVTFIRLSKNHFLNNNNLIVNENDKMWIISLFSEKDKYVIESYFAVVLNDDVLADLLLFFNNRSMTQTEKIEIYPMVKSMYLDFINEFDIHLQTESINHITELLSTIILSYYSDPYFLFDVSTFDFNILKYHFPESMKASQRIMKDLFEALNIEDDSRCNDMIITLIRFTTGAYEAFINYESKLTVNLFLVSDKAHALFIHKLLSDRFSNLATFKLIDSSKLLKSHELANELWISDISTLTSTNLLIIEPTIIYSEMPRIKKFLFENRNTNSYL